MFSVKLLNSLYSIVFIVAVVGINGIFCDDTKVVSTNDGDVRGLRKTTIRKNVDYYSFKGIPYAEAPIGELRFKAPEPVKSWSPNALDALEFGTICWQNGEFFPIAYPMSEDCLFLNIYVPAKPKTTEKLPVLFFIHGGGYAEGHGNDNMYGPDFIVEADTILVTINYRLGILGFLSLNSPEYSGNMGLKDQQLALKWIHENIEHFNGDKNKITIFGQSAGGASTHFHMLSAESRKYFRNAIPMSGSAFNYWATSKKNDHSEYAFMLAKDFDKPTDNFDELIETLKSAAPDKLTKYYSVFLSLGHSFTLFLGPVIERTDAKRPIITQSVSQIYENADFDVDALFTFTSAESLILIPKSIDLDELNRNFTIDLPFETPSLSYDSDEYREIAQELRQFYFGDDEITAKKIDKYVDLSSDINFAYFIDKAAKIHATKTKGKTFYLKFSVDSKLNMYKHLTKLKFPGASHCDDLCYLFHHKMVPRMYENVLKNADDDQSKISIQTIEHMVGIFTKFAKLERAQCETCSGLGFRSIQKDEINYLHVTNNGLERGTNPNYDEFQLWSNIERKLQKYITSTPEVERDEL